MSDELPEVGPWARDKLERLRKYLSAYTKILANQSWVRGYVYVDAFAGSGRVRLRPARSADPTIDIFDLGREFRADEEARSLLDGSPRVALEVEPPFTRYVFLDHDPKRIAMLESLQNEYKGRRNIVVRKDDCNDYLNQLIRNPRVNWKEWRAIVFLDPFGMQVPWKTIEGLANTGAIEVFLNFPVGMSIQRMLLRNRKFTEQGRSRLDNYFGDTGWFDVVYPKSPGLFGPQASKATDAEERLVEWYRGRLKSAFGHVSRAHLVRNSHGGHLYFLVFAGPNATGARIADNVLRAGTRI